MGRVSKYKKVKAFDPFAKKSTKGKSGLLKDGMSLDPKRRASLKKRERRERRNRKSCADGGFDIPPEHDDFDIADPSLTIKPVLPTSKNPLNTNSEDSIRVKVQGIECDIPKTEEDETMMARILRQTDNAVSTVGMKEASVLEQKEGESTKVFRERLREETRIALLAEKRKSINAVKNPERAAKKKAFLQKKKLKKKGRSFQNDAIDEAFDEERFDKSKQITGLVEQADRPPTLNVIPRGATRKKTNGKSKRSGMTKEQELKEEKEIELLRNRVQESYAQLRLKRKEDHNSRP